MLNLECFFICSTATCEALYDEPIDTLSTNIIGTANVLESRGIAHH